MTRTRLIPLDGCHNLRDLGGYPASHGVTAWGRVLRADSLHRLTPDTMAHLRGLGCTDVIDLRNEDELGFQPNPFAAGHPGIRYHNISLLGELDPTRTDLFDAPDVLLELYCRALADCGPRLAEVLRLIAGARGTVVFHCTAGKDRTGLIAAFLLLLAGVRRSDIVADYALTARQAPAMFADLHRELEAGGRNFDPASPLLASNAATMEAFLHHLAIIHGGAETYLRTNGLSDADITALRTRMLHRDLTEGAA
tara:strand:+ start:933 stop:1691 length:759 start_codon:yes stop_codon:yes gene_type:complete